MRASAPAESDRARLAIALLLIDVINDFNFDGSEVLVREARAAAPRIEALADSARRNEVPVIYVNDNFGMWQSDFRAVVDECLLPEKSGRTITERLRPTASDYFVLKPRHSGFLGTPLESLLDHLKVNVICLAGFATDSCVLFTAVDAHSRGFHVVVPSDCTAANDESAKERALALIAHTLRAPIPKGDEVDWGALGSAERKRLF